MQSTVPSTARTQRLLDLHRRPGHFSRKAAEPFAYSFICSIPYNVIRVKAVKELGSPHRTFSRFSIVGLYP